MMCKKLRHHPLKVNTTKPNHLDQLCIVRLSITGKRDLASKMSSISRHPRKIYVTVNINGSSDYKISILHYDPPVISKPNHHVAGSSFMDIDANTILKFAIRRNPSHITINCSSIITFPRKKSPIIVSLMTYGVHNR